MELRDYPRVLLKHWFGILLITALTFGAVAAYTFSQPKVYSASAQMFISVSARVTTTTNGQTLVSGSTPYVLQRLASYVAIAGSPLVLDPISQQLGFTVSGGQVTADNPGGTVIIDVSATSGDPVQAAEIANAASQQLVVVIEKLEAQFVGTSVSVVVTPTVTQQATPSSSPTSPRTRTNLVIGLLLGLVLGVGYAFLRNFLDNTVKTQDQLNEATGATSIGMISFDPLAKDKPLVTMEQRAARSEAFRTIRTNLRYVDVDKPPKIITITSAVPGEGKSTTAINLAITMAQAGRSVCLVETDLRRPKMGRYLGIDMGLGLTSVLSGQCALEEALLPWNRGMFTVLPSGSTPPNPSELLGSKHMREILASLRKSFDAVILDAPPLLPVTDGAIITAASDGALLVVRWGKTTREQLAAASQAVAQVDGRILGTVMNFVPTPRGRYAYKYNYGYGYGYGSGYGEGADAATPQPAAPSQAEA